MKDFLVNLNKEQYEAATTLDGAVLIVAGAGTGKTHTLVSRVANMLDEGISGSEILLLTFTNKAALEMKERIIEEIGEEAEEVTACTFHSFCANFIRQNGKVLNLKSNFNVLSMSDCKEAMSLAMQEYFDKHHITQPCKDFPTKGQLLGVYSTSVNNCITIREVIKDNQKLRVYESEIEEIISNYGSYKLQHNVFDYDDLLYLTKFILENCEDIRASMDKQFKYISCDEYQDTNIIQDMILNLLSQDYCNLAVVGDDNQSIYKFRGANIENILTFDKRYKNCKKIVLNQNYRSTQEILDVSNAMMKHAKEGEEKELIGQSKGIKPQLIMVDNPYQEADKIVHFIKQYQLGGLPLKEIAVIARWASQTNNLEIELNKAGIPFKKFGGLKLLEKDCIQDILSFLRVIVNEKDELALYRLLKMYPGIGDKTARKITLEVCQHGLHNITNVSPSAKYYKDLEELYRILTRLMSLPLQKQLEFVIDDYYLKTMLRTIDLSNRNTEAKLEWRNKVISQTEEAKVLISLADNYQSTIQYLMDLSLEAAIPRDGEDFVNVTTIHSAKGLEYKVVFVLDLIEGVTPKTSENTSEDNEELRCLYVALTRAKKNLYMFVPKQYNGVGFNTYQTTLSHFINYDNVMRTIDTTQIPDYELKKVRNKYQSFGYSWL